MSDNNNNIQATQPQANKPGGISLLDIFDLAKVYFWELLRNFWIILIVAGLLGGYLYYRKSKEQTVYTATITFTMNSEVDMGKNMLNALGLNLGGGGEYSSDRPDLRKMEELMITRMLMKKTLFSREKMTLGWGAPKEDYLVNHYLHHFWYKDDPNPANFYFQKDSLDPLNRDENMRFMSIHSTINKVHVKKFASQAGTMNLSFQSNCEEFGYIFVRTMFEQLKDFYFKDSRQRQEIVYDAAKRRVDSLEIALAMSEAAYYNFLNTHQLYTRQDVAIKQQRLNRRMLAETEGYLMSLRNQEVAKIALEQHVPAIKVLDEPIYPLPVEKPNPFWYGVIGAVVGGILGSGIVIGRKLLRDMLRKEREKRAAAAN